MVHTRGSLDLALLQTGLSNEQVCERQRSALAGLPEFGVKDMASWFRFVVLSRPVLLQGPQVGTVCGVLGWEGREKEREEEQDGVGKRERRKGGDYSSSFKTSLSTLQAPTSRVGQTRP